VQGWRDCLPIGCRAAGLAPMGSYSLRKLLQGAGHGVVGIPHKKRGESSSVGSQD